jgi:hypothetical protein
VVSKSQKRKADLIQLPRQAKQEKGGKRSKLLRGISRWKPGANVEAVSGVS